MIGMIIGGVAMGASMITGGIGMKQDQMAAKKQKKMQMHQMEMQKLSVQQNTAYAIKEQYKSFGSYMKAQESIISSQNAFLGANAGISKYSSITQDVANEQVGEFYSAEENVASSIEKAYADERMALLGIDMNKDTIQANYMDAMRGSKMNFANSIISSVGQLAMAGMSTGYFGGSKDTLGSVGSFKKPDTSLGLNIFG